MRAPSFSPRRLLGGAFGPTFTVVAYCVMGVGCAWEGTAGADIITVFFGSRKFS